MFLAQKMDKVSFLLLREDLEAVLDAVAGKCLLHPARVEDVDTWASSLAQEDTAAATNAYTKQQARIERLIGALLPGVRKGVEGLPRHAHLSTPEEIVAALDPIENEVAPLLAEQDDLVRQDEALRRLRDTNAPLMMSGIPLLQLSRSETLVTTVGIVDERRLPHLDDLLQSLPALAVSLGQAPDGLLVCVVALRQDRERLQQALSEVGFRETSHAEDLVVLAEATAGQLQDCRRAVDAKLRSLAASALPELRARLQETADALQVLRLREVCRLTGASCLLMGWTPSRMTVSLIEAVRARTGGRVVVDVVAADALEDAVDGVVDVPVLLEHPRVFRPFEAVVATYGTPSYRMIDPTVIVSITFLAMFGMMFGDLGHGAVLIAMGLFLSARFPALCDVGRLMTYCGTSACVFGLLFGSVFGIETLLPTLWVKPLEDIGTLFATAIGFGVAVISIGIVLNTLNAIRSRAFARRFFDPSGPLGGIAYWTGVALAVMVLSSPDRSPFFVPGLCLFSAALLSFFLKAPMLKMLGKRDKACPEGLASYLMETTFEIAEFLMGYLANTVSFIRVAAFGLAHAGLFVAVFGLCDIVAKAPGGGWMSALILIAGNALIIVLEGVVVTIQILRLEYYEFFGKFFNHYGTEYRPVGYRATSAASTV